MDALTQDDITFGEPIDEEGEGGGFNAFHHKDNPLLTKAQPEHNIVKKGHSTLSKAFDMSSLTA